MAPEGERAKGFCGKQMTRWNPGTGAMFCNSAPGHEGSCSYTYFFRDDSPPKEPTLTCSEVVERLEKLLLGTDTRRAADIAKFRAEATAIFHSWRERRVRELEELLAKRSGCSHCNDSAPGGTSANDPTEIRKDLYTQKLESLLYDCILELSYVQSVENCRSELCASANGEQLINLGMKLLEVPDLSEVSLKLVRGK